MSYILNIFPLAHYLLQLRALYVSLTLQLIIKQLLTTLAYLNTIIKSKVEKNHEQFDSRNKVETFLKVLFVSSKQLWNHLHR